MAFKPTDLNNFTAADGNYPYGSSKDETAPGAGDGSEYKKARADDIFGFQQALLNAAGIVPSGNADNIIDSDYLNSLKFIAGTNLHSDKINYIIGSACQGSDGFSYEALQPNGPGTSVVDPVGNPLTWFKDINHMNWPVNSYSGLKTTWNSVSSISYGVGSATGLNDTLLMQNNAAFTKLTSAVWVAGTGNGGLASGASLTPNGNLYSFIILLADYSVDFGFDDDVTGANLVSDSGAIAIRGVRGHILDGVGDIVDFIDRGGDVIELRTPVRDLSDAAPTTSVTSVIVSAPANIGVLGNFGFQVIEGDAVNRTAWLRSPGQTFDVPSGSNMDLEVSSIDSRETINKMVSVGQNGDIQYRLNGVSTTTVRIFTNGWIENHDW